jgi:putative peptidoglycan lipid II flippase
MSGLVLANTVQNSAHALILLLLLWRAMGGRGDLRLGAAALRVAVAGALMGAFLGALLRFWPTPDGSLGLLLFLTLASAGAGLVYLGALALLRSEELAYTRELVMARIGRRNS